MPPSPYQDSESALEAYCGELRLALRHLVDAVTYAHLPLPEGLPPDEAQTFTRLMRPTWAIQAAREVLRMEDGRDAEAMLALMADLNSLVYIFADYVHWQMFGTRRSPHGNVPLVGDLLEALGKLDSLTRQIQGVEAARGGPGQKDILHGA